MHLDSYIIGNKLTNEASNIENNQLADGFFYFRNLRLKKQS